MAKLEILHPKEQLRFNNPPNLSPDEQVKYFLLPQELATWIESVTNLTNKVGFILLWGYCQAGVRFYKPRQFCASDIRAVCQQYNLSSASIQMTDYKQRTYNYHKQIIRQHTYLKAFDDGAKEFFLESIQDRVARHYSPKQILQEVFELLKVKKIEMPRYNRFALMITQAISDYDKHLLRSVESSLLEKQKISLDDLLQVDETGCSKIAGFKNISNSKRPKKIKESMLDFQLITRIYQSITTLLRTLNLHTDTVKHYATWVRKASLFQIS